MGFWGLGLALILILVLTLALTLALTAVEQNRLCAVSFLKEARALAVDEGKLLLTDTGGVCARLG